MSNHKLLMAFLEKEKPTIYCIADDSPQGFHWELNFSKMDSQCASTLALATQYALIDMYPNFPMQTDHNFEPTIPEGWRRLGEKETSQFGDYFAFHDFQPAWHRCEDLDTPPWGGVVIRKLPTPQQIQ